MARQKYTRSKIQPKVWLKNIHIASVEKKIPCKRCIVYFLFNLNFNYVAVINGFIFLIGNVIIK